MNANTSPQVFVSEAQRNAILSLCSSFGMAPRDLTWHDKVSYVIGHGIDMGIVKKCDLPYTVVDHGEYMVRSVTVPADTLVFGRVHKIGHLLQLEKGNDLMFSEAGVEARTAPWQRHMYPGFRMTRYTLSETIVHAYLPNTDHLSEQELMDKYFQTEEQFWEHAKLTYANHRPHFIQLKSLPPTGNLGLLQPTLKTY